jgi:DNA-binding GntR family transcriptional regulator
MLVLYHILTSQLQVGTVVGVSRLSQSNEPLVRHSLANLVYDRLLDSILSGALASDAEINVSDVAKELGVSPIPVREALVRLSTEGLVETSANRRARVVHISRQDVVAVFQVRQILESGAA